MKNYQKAVAVLVGLGLSVAEAQAAIDVTAVSTGISDAQTAILAILGALLTLSTAIYGLAAVQRFMKRRAGA
ncbi:MAG: major capsid protein [Gallionella sp.]|nr:major capsid protein [Gallionella sp.]